jgi:two-component system, LytTR family, response regulator
MTMLRALIADDERLGRQKIRSMLDGHDDVTVVAECANGGDAAAEIRRHRPDLVFLDIEMPGSDAFDVLRRIRDETPAIIFVTGHGEYALRAFDVDAVDYLLKPFDRRRFNEALRRARKRIETGTVPKLVSALEHIAQKDGQCWHRFVVKSHGRMLLVPAADVHWIEAEGKYVRIHTASASHLIRSAIGDVEEHLDPAEFARIHRGTIVNLRKVAEIYRGFGGDYIVVMRAGQKLTLSRRYWSKLRQVGGLL